ncbi:amino acid/polyamine transporter I, partial [Choanephora cucurbitarum]
MLLSWNLVAFFMFCVACALAELCSLYPKSGGLYYWVFEMLDQHPTTKPRAPLIAFITGWMYAIANVISIGATNVTVALSLSSIFKLLFHVDLDKMYLMMITLCITWIHACLNVYQIHLLSLLNQWNVISSCLGLLVIVLILSWMVPHQEASWVFLHYENQTGFDHPGYVFMLGMIGAAYSLLGCECSAAMNEETKEADKSSSIAMVSSIAVSWLVGFLFLLALLFSIQDIDNILHSTLAMPVAQLFYDAIGRQGTLMFLMLMMFCQFCTGATTTTVTSRQIYALARDHAIPMHSELDKISSNKLPENAVWCTMLLTFLVILPYPLSDHVFETIVSATTITIHFSYAMVLGCRLFYITTIGHDQGRFHLGKYSLWVTWIGFLWTCFAVFAFTLPANWPLVANTMNYAGIAWICTLSVTCLTWLLWGQFFYYGPRAMHDGI